MSLIHERPTNLDDVVGNAEVISSLKATLAKDNHSHCFMFQGMSGSGKTTVIRILAQMLGATELDIHEYNIADARGIDTAREIIEYTSRVPLGKATIITLDECFPARTLVHTEDGRKSISQICKERYNGKVLSYNIAEKRYEYKPVVNWIEKKTDNDLLVFEGNGFKLCMTDNHKIYDEHFNLKQAKEFTVGESMIVADKTITNCSISDEKNYGLVKIHKIYYEKPESKCVYNIEVEDNHNYFVHSGFLVGNCHKATGNFQEALLKPTEDVPDHVYFFMATTEPSKIIPTLKRRFTKYSMKYPEDIDLLLYTKKIANKHGIELSKKVLNALVEKSGGSIANMLNLLDTVQGLEEETQLELLAEFVDDEKSAIDLCQALLYSKGTWAKVSKIVSELLDKHESVRYTILAYMSKVLLNTKSGKLHSKAALIIDAFKEPFADKAEFIVVCYALVTE